MWYMLFGLGLWLLCGYIGVALWHKYMEEEFQAKSSISFFHMLTGPCALVASVWTIHKTKQEKKGE